MQDDPKDVIRQFILSTYLPGESRDNLRDDTPLQTSGILDSLATLQLVSFVEKHFNIELDIYETSVEHFDRIGVTRRMGDVRLAGRLLTPRN